MSNMLTKFNTVIGLGAGRNLQIGSHNVLIGTNAGKDLTISSNRLIIDLPSIAKVDIQMEEQDAIELATTLSRILSKGRFVNNTLTNMSVNCGTRDK